MLWLRGEILIAILGHDFVDVIVAHLALAVAGEDSQISNIELGRKLQDNVVRNIGGIREKRPQESDGTKLKSKAQACMSMAPGVQQSAITIIEMKVASKLFWRGFPRIATIANALFSSQKLNRHSVVPFHMTR